MTDIRPSENSEASSESLESLSENTPLLPQSLIPSISESNSTTTTTTTALQPEEQNGPTEPENLPLEEPVKPQSVFGIIGLLLIGVFVANVDSTMVIATYSIISSKFGALESAAWLTTSYVLAMCGIQAIVGKLSDIYGRKPVLLASYVAFAGGSILV
jgi:hypothetical protein